MQKQIKLASGLSVMETLIAVYGSPAHAGWVRTANPDPNEPASQTLSLNARATMAKVSATGTAGPPYDGSPVASGNVDVYFQ